MTVKFLLSAESPYSLLQTPQLVYVENRIEYVTTVLECPALGVSLQDVLFKVYESV
jgi:hypothetical protein